MDACLVDVVLDLLVFYVDFVIFLLFGECFLDSVLHLGLHLLDVMVCGSGLGRDLLLLLNQLHLSLLQAGDLSAHSRLHLLLNEVLLALGPQI